mgnify:CR=1 FL=1
MSHNNACSSYGFQTVQRRISIHFLIYLKIKNTTTREEYSDFLSLFNKTNFKKAIKYFEGEHDFKAFKASGTSSKSSVRTIYSAQIIKEQDEQLSEIALWNSYSQQPTKENFGKPKKHIGQCLNCLKQLPVL